ncbi:MAG: hypothetical protein U0795_10055 [Pirellulales bacterium]
MDAKTASRTGHPWPVGIISLGILACLALATSGCSPSKPAPEKSGAASQSAQPPAAGAEQGAGSKIEQALAKLSPEDRQSAEAQKICPVSGEALGSMGAPVKFDVEGRTVWVCCAGCEQPVKDDPATYLAKIPAATPPAK